MIIYQSWQQGAKTTLDGLRAGAWFANIQGGISKVRRRERHTVWIEEATGHITVMAAGADVLALIPGARVLVQHREATSAGEILEIKAVNRTGVELGPPGSHAYWSTSWTGLQKAINRAMGIA